LLGKKETLGVIYVDCLEPQAMFSADDVDLLNALAVATSMAVDSVMTHDQLVKEALARAAYGRFVPRHVVDEILANPNAVSLGGTNQRVTALFSDIRRFTAIAEGLPPEQVVQLLNRFFANMTPIVFGHQGLLDKYMGDGLMALFGVPYEDQDAATNAASAAICMQLRVLELNEDLKREGLPEIEIGIGINTGTVTVGYIGSDQRTDYTAIGDAVNLAARLENQAESRQILISRSTLEAIAGQFKTRSFGALTVRGKKEPVQVYEILWNEEDERAGTAISLTSSQ
jgi:adenylate cyclase